MAVSDGFLEFVLEQLAGLGGVSSRRMFGGAGLYAGDVFFAVLDNDTLFFRVDDATVGPYKKARMPPFQPYPGDPTTSFGYYQVPARVLEDPDVLVAWARRAVEVASRSRRRQKKAATGKKRRSRAARNPASSRRV